MLLMPQRRRDHDNAADHHGGVEDRGVDMHRHALDKGWRK